MVGEFSNRSGGFIAVAGLLAVLMTAGCAQQSGGGAASPGLGTLGGAAAGGALGSLVGGGRGRTAAIVGGAVLGGIVGNQAVDRPVEERQAREREASRDRAMQRQLDYERQSALQEEQVRREIEEQRLYEEWRSQRVGGEQVSGGGDVAQAQRLLTAHGLYSGPIDGIDGPGTQSATRAFQARQGLPQTGILTPSLVSLMRSTI